MNISPNDAEEALAAIQKTAQRTRRSIAASGAHISLIATGTVWLIGFVFELCHAGKLAVRSYTAEDPGEFGMLRHHRLDEKNGFFGIDTAGSSYAIFSFFPACSISPQ